MRTFLGGATLGLFAGLLAGWLAFSGSPRVELQAPDARAAGDASDLGQIGGSGSPEPRESPPSRRAVVAPEQDVAPRSHTEAMALIANLESELAAVGAEAREARDTLERIREEARAAEEKERARIPVPDDLPERFAQGQLMRSVGEALGKLGGEISAIDCTEHPCIVYADLPGRGVPPPVEFKSFMDDPAMAAYAEDSRMHFAYDDTDEVGNHLARHTGFAFFPKASGADTTNEELGERVHKRVREWRKATQAHPDEK